MTRDHSTFKSHLITFISRKICVFQCNVDLFFFVFINVLVMLKNHAAACRLNPSMKPYLAIPHVRDALIPLADRLVTFYVHITHW